MAPGIEEKEKRRPKDGNEVGPRSNQKTWSFDYSKQPRGSYYSKQGRGGQAEAFLID